MTERFSSNELAALKLRDAEIEIVDADKLRDYALVERD
ncbi:hypothetical protein OKW43_001259 [Paraburkholderia sp. WC7.3g]